MADILSGVAILITAGLVFYITREQAISSRQFQRFKDISGRHARLSTLRTRGTESYIFMNNILLSQMARHIDRSIPRRQRN